MRIDWSQANKNRPPLDVCRVRNGGSPNTYWPSWYARDMEHARYYVRVNRTADPSSYSLCQEYAVIDHRSGDEVGRFTVAEAMEIHS